MVGELSWLILEALSRPTPNFLILIRRRRRCVVVYRGDSVGTCTWYVVLQIAIEPTLVFFGRRVLTLHWLRSLFCALAMALHRPSKNTISLSRCSLWFRLLRGVLGHRIYRAQVVVLTFISWSQNSMSTKNYFIFSRIQTLHGYRNGYMIDT